MGLKPLLLIIPFLFLLAPGEAILLRTGLRIQPNSSSSGYYVLNTAIRVDNLTVSSTYATFENVLEGYRRVHDDTNNIELYADCGFTLRLPQTSSVINISFLRVGEEGSGVPSVLDDVLYLDNITDVPDGMQEVPQPTFLDMLGTWITWLGEIRIEKLLALFRMNDIIFIMAVASISALSIYGTRKEIRRRKAKRTAEQRQNY